MKMCHKAKYVIQQQQKKREENEKNVHAVASVLESTGLQTAFLLEHVNKQEKTIGEQRINE